MSETQNAQRGGYYIMTPIIRLPHTKRCLHDAILAAGGKIFWREKGMPTAWHLPLRALMSPLRVKRTNKQAALRRTCADSLSPPSRVCALGAIRSPKKKKKKKRNAQPSESTFIRLILLDVFPSHPRHDVSVPTLGPRRSSSSLPSNKRDELPHNAADKEKPGK